MRKTLNSPFGENVRVGERRFRNGGNEIKRDLSETYVVQMHR